ncbi:Bug family tripartite tricarboxylate transporter substrate binding protein [Alicycliphilus denitrificans]|uniref:Extra-cytoplasmic solute receptor family protein 94 n=1 Tax=Alicycliphilus denitrificans (strain DSM 14773 / CIP 107495 / K601) TaxID=596154 RepID=F4G607_ALIDK|nr:tripartite tricarboxylate transporter substrate binding protein [Alicycliphilus denitrificans]AEB86488.1 extra-cytoplasmic solute receptor family protein 94 [Alicycliphilus denitrificans K601]
MIHRRTLIALAASATLLAAAPTHAQSDWKPVRPVKLLVGFAPGGSADTLARLIAEPLSQKLGQPVVVDNVPGAGGNIMAGRLATSAADGYTLGIGAAGSMAITFELNPKATPYKPESFTPVTMLATQPNVVIVNMSVPANNIGELKDYIARTPSASYGIAGIGISNHLIAEAMLARMGVKMAAVPYKGAAPVITDLLGGHIAMTMDNITTAAQLAKEGKVKALGVTTAKRAPQLPDVPTLQEQGLAGFDMPTWQGLFLPAGTPAPVVAAYYAAMQDILKSASTREKMAHLGSQPVVGMKPAQFTAYLEADRKQWAATIKAARIEPQ